jgi:hypothetical protein
MKGAEPGLRKQLDRLLTTRMWKAPEMARQSISKRLTAAQLRSVLHYDPETGLFRWHATIDHWRAGLPAGTKSKRHVVLGLGTTRRTNQQRHYVLGIKKRVYLAHRLAWLYVYGTWPKGHIDHINCDGSDNRIANLRLATPRQNCCNRRRRSDNTSGVKGVSWSKRTKRWVAHIQHQGKNRHVGSYVSIEEAAAGYAAAAVRFHGEYARFD